MAREVFEPNDLAYSRRQQGQRPLQVWAGEADKITEVFEKADAAATFAKYEVVGVDDSGKIIKFAKGGKVLGFTAQPIGASDASAAIYTGGFPNHEALVWPADIATFEERRAQFIGHGAIHIGKLNGAIPE